MRHLHWVILTDVLLAMLVIGVSNAALYSGFTRFGVADAYILGTPLALSGLLSVFAGIATFIFLIRFKPALSFFDEVIGELFRVHWPSREETLRASVTVVVTTIATAALLAAYDFIWKNVADYFLYGIA
jgi:preprotein translocase SecE subunit